MISQDIRYVGVNDHAVDLFEGQYVVPNGMSYNSYIIMDDKIAVMDTVDAHFCDEWLSKIASELNGRKPDYLIIQHMEPDHSAGIEQFMAVYPQTTLVSNAKAFAMLDQFYTLSGNENRLTVKDGETLDLGHHQLTFVFAMMVHWPEVMVTYDAPAKLLFSADAFGKFGALDVDEPWADEARRYYIGIVGKYGAQAQKLLKAASTLDIQTICPLHGPVLTENLPYYIGLYDTWSSYRAQTDGVMIAYASVYGNTRKAATLLAEKLKAKGCANVVLSDLSRADMAECIANAFRYNKLVLATLTYNGELFPCMTTFIHGLVQRNFQNRTVGLMENGTWGPVANRTMTAQLEKCKNITFCQNAVTIRSAVKPETEAAIDALAEELIH